MASSKSNGNQREVRREKHLRQLGTREPHCIQCSETDPAALTGTDPTILCYECQAQTRDHSPIEAHHVAGRHNDPMTVTIPGNAHRILSDLQKDWPQETLRNPNGSPLRKAAATLRSWQDILIVLLERVLRWIPPFLERLDERLVASMGDQWWVNIGWQEGIL